jgi:hypothetical protein
VRQQSAAICCFSIIMLCSVTASAPVPKGAEVPTWYYPMQVGSERTYTSNDGEHIETVVKVDDADNAKIIVVSKHGKKGEKLPSDTLRVSQAGIFRLRLGEEEFDPPVCLLMTPYNQGNKWATESRGGRLTLQGTCTDTASEVELVEVPAGQFKAIRVDQIFTPARPGPALKSTVWYGVGVGVVKWKSGDDEMVLTKLNLDRK